MPVLQVIAVAFGSGADFEGRVLAAVDRLEGRGVRVVDVLFVAKSEDGVIERLVIGDDEDFGEILASVCSYRGVDLVATSAPGSIPRRMGTGSVARAGDRTRACSSSTAGRVTLRRDRCDRWTLVGEGFLTQEAGLLVGAEVAAMEEAVEVIESRTPPKP